MRERLGLHYRETHCFTAYFHSYAKTDEGSNVVCLYKICLGQREVADHCWIHRSKQMKQLKLQHGDFVQFEARVGRYARLASLNLNSAVEHEFNLEKVRDVQVLRRANGEHNGG